MSASVISTGVLRTPEGKAVADRPSLRGRAPVPPAWKTVTEKIPPKPPIVVPAAEAKGVRPGELLEAYVTGEASEGHILEVHRKGTELQLVQWRGNRFDG